MSSEASIFCINQFKIMTYIEMKLVLNNKKRRTLNKTVATKIIPEFCNDIKGTIGNYKVQQNK